MKRFALLLAAGTAFVSPALAADVIYEEPPAPVAMAPVPTWTGFYIGVQGGGAFNPNNPDNINVDTSFGTPVVVGGVDQFTSNYSSSSDSSFIGGGHAGYDYQMDQFVLGAVIDINAVDFSRKAGVVSRTADAFYNEERSIDYLATARLRAGYLVTPTALAYATGGLAYADIDYKFETNSGSAAGVRTRSDEDDFGYSVGGGMEVKITDNVSFGAEYLYTNLGDGDSSATFTSGPFTGGVAGGTTTFETDEDFDFHTVTAKVSYRFN